MAVPAHAEVDQTASNRQDERDSDAAQMVPSPPPPFPTPQSAPEEKASGSSGDKCIARQSEGTSQAASPLSTGTAAAPSTAPAPHVATSSAVKPVGKNPHDSGNTPQLSTKGATADNMPNATVNDVPTSPAIQFGDVVIDGSGWDRADEKRHDTEIKGQKPLVEAQSPPSDDVGETDAETAGTSETVQPSSAASSKQDDVETTPQLSESAPTGSPPSSSNSAPFQTGQPQSTPAELPAPGTAAPTPSTTKAGTLLTSTPSPRKPVVTKALHAANSGGQQGDSEVAAESTDRKGGKSRERRDNASAGSSHPRLSSTEDHGQVSRASLTKGLLSSPSLAGSVPAPYMPASWKPLPVGMAASAFGIVGTVDTGVNAGVGPGGAPSQNGGVEMWGVPPQVAATARPDGTFPSGGIPAEIPSPLTAGQGDWVGIKGARAGFGPAGAASRGTFGPNSAPAAPSPAGWTPTPVLGQPTGGMVGMAGVNGGGSNVGGRLRSASDAFGVGTGATPGMQPPVAYGALAPRPTILRSGSAGRDGTLDANQGLRNHESGQPSGMVPSLGGTVAGNAFGGFMLGYQSPGARQPPLPGTAWGGAGISQSAGSPGTNAAAIGGTQSPPGAQQQQQRSHPQHQHQQAVQSPPQQAQRQHPHQEQQQQQAPQQQRSPQQALPPPLPLPPPQVQQQQPPQQHPQQQAIYTSLVSAMNPGGARMVSSTQHTMASSMPASPAPAVTDGTTGGNSGLAAEAPPFIPAGAMGMGSPAMWGMAGQRPQPGRALPGAPPLPNPMMLSPTVAVSQGLRFGGGGMPMGVGLRRGPIAGAVPGPGMGPAPVRGMLPQPPPAVLATQQMQQQQLQQQQMHQQQVCLVTVIKHHCTCIRVLEQCMVARSKRISRSFSAL